MIDPGGSPVVFEPKIFKIMNSTAQVSEPSILTANTYFWKPGQNASSRRRNEERNQNKVADFFRSIGMEVTQKGDDIFGQKGYITAVFSYSESCKNVYKSLSVKRNGKNSNILSLRKLYQQ